MTFPTPQTALGKAALRASIVAVTAAIGYLMQDPSIAQGSLLYFILKTTYDTINPNVPNL